MRHESCHNRGTWKNRSDEEDDRQYDKNDADDIATCMVID